MRILVTGGTGYIGGFMVRALLEKSHEVIVIDNLSRSDKGFLPSEATFFEGDIGDRSLLSRIFTEYKIDGVINFAGLISMGESMENPYIYFNTNTFQTLNLLEAMHEHQVNNFIFSSTAGVYGDPEVLPIPEDHPKNPNNPYGESKLMVEKLLSWYQKIYGINYAALRYFNACGASLDGEMGERHVPESHIIPNAMSALIEDKEFLLFGTDYDTPDGTCVRDYIHVLDLVESHILALQKIMSDPGGYIYNVGTGKGYSNREIIQAIEKVSGKTMKVKEADRRPGDANELVANVSKITQDLSFTPQYSDLNTIIESAWKWHTREA